ncbi:hypothetical protein ACS0TY_032889 [Phlomoides rotata]
MEGEIKNSIVVWTTIVACLCYCHTASKIFTTAISRRLSIFPIVCLFLLLPLKLTSIHIAGVTSFFIAWLASFKLILLAFQKGPLYSNPPIPLSLFIPLACFPIKIQHSKHKKTQKSRINFATKIFILALLIQGYSYKEHIHTKIIWSFYCIHIYLMLEMLISLFGALARAVVRAELEPPFNEPYLATSLQDFWSRRWNLMVSNILHPTVFQPVRGVSARLVGRKWAAIPAVLATFLVSGLMHELILYNFGRVKPSGEMMSFFVLHGVSLSTEIVIKKVLSGKYSLPGVVSGPLTLAYVMYTSFGLFFPPFLRAKAELKGCTESLAFLEFIRTGRLVSPNEMSCPFL